jgi:hypothetical protein
MKQGLSRNNNMEPGWLIWMTDNVTFKIPEVPAGLIEKSVPVPWRGAEIPEMRNYKEYDTEEKEGCLRPYQGLQTSRQAMPGRQESAQQKEHAEHPPDRLPRISPSRFTIMRDAAHDTDYQTNK